MAKKGTKVEGGSNLDSLLVWKTVFNRKEAIRNQRLKERKWRRLETLVLWLFTVFSLLFFAAFFYLLIVH